jgi:hypothetical protein
MTLPVSGPISFNNIRTEFQVQPTLPFADRHMSRGIAPFINKSPGTPISLSEFYGVTRPTNQISTTIGSWADAGTYFELNFTNWQIGTSRYYMDFIRQGKGANATDRWVTVGFYVTSGLCDAVLERILFGSNFDVSRLGDAGSGYSGYTSGGFPARQAQFYYTNYVGILPPQVSAGLSGTLIASWSNFY